MFKRIEKYLKNELDQVVFIELKKDAHVEAYNFEVLKDIPIPIHIKELTKTIKDEKNTSDISLASMARGMIYLMGLDSEFKYIPSYKTFLCKFDEKIKDYICYEGLKLAEKEKFLEALLYFKALLLLDENNINALYNYARCCEDIAKKSEDVDAKNDYKKEAVEVLEIMIEKYPTFYQAYYHLGFHYANQQLFKKAELTWEECLSLEIPEEKKNEVLFQLASIKDQIQYEEGYTFILNNQPALGIEKLVPLLEKYAEWWNLLFFIALGYRQLGDVNRAITYLKKILAIKPTQVDTWNELGLCYAMLNEFDKAEKHFQKALRFKGDDNEILSNLGMLYMEQGKLELAKEVLEKAMQLDPEDEVTQQCVKKLEALDRGRKHR
ncbi:tetratricopeptide repeat protein [Clostridiaceae bacterium 35-E11]